MAEKGVGVGEEGPSLSRSMELRKVSSLSAAAAAAAAMFADSRRSSSGGRLSGCELGSSAKRPPLPFFDGFALRPDDLAVEAVLEAGAPGMAGLCSRRDLDAAAAAAGVPEDDRGAALLLREEGDEGEEADGCGLELGRRWGALVGLLCAEAEVLAAAVGEAGGGPNGSENSVVSRL